MRFVLVTLFDDEGDTWQWHFGSWEEAEKWAEERMEKDNFYLSYVLEEQELIPCDKSNPQGMYYIGVHRTVTRNKEEK